MHLQIGTMNKFTMPEIEKKADFVKTNFNRIAEKYDFFNDVSSFYMHRYWKNSIIREIEKKFKEDKINCLDLCCGTGDISVRLVNMKTAGEVTCIDFSDSMLSVAKERLKNEPKAKLQIGDATNLKEVPSGSMDVVTIGFGLRNVNDLKKALGEIYRVLKPGGLFINLDVGKVEIKLIKFFADFYFFKIVPLMGYLIWGGKNEMFDYLPVSSLSYPDQKNLSRLMEESGFKDVAYKNFVFGNAALHRAVK